MSNRNKEDPEYFEAVEMCPECGAENVFPYWNVKEKGYIAQCSACGSKIFLCDECFHSEDNPTMDCNWQGKSDCSVCMRGKIKKENPVITCEEYTGDVYTWDRICEEADGKPFGSPELARKDTAREEVRTLCVALCDFDIEEEEIPEEAIEEFLNNYPWKDRFDEEGGMI